MSSKVNLSTLIAAFAAHLEVQRHLAIDGCFKFIELIQFLKPTLSPSSSRYFRTSPLEHFPPSFLDFIKKCLSLEHNTAKIIWEAIAPIAWSLGAPEDIQACRRFRSTVPSILFGQRCYNTSFGTVTANFYK